jgi:hypothetical protein
VSGMYVCTYVYKKIEGFKRKVYIVYKMHNAVEKDFGISMYEFCMIEKRRKSTVLTSAVIIPASVANTYLMKRTSA